MYPLPKLMFLCKIKSVSYPKYLKPATLLVFVLVIVSTLYYLYISSSRSVPIGNRLIDPFGKELELGYFSVTDDQGLARVATQVKSVGSDASGYYLEAVFETPSGQITNKISLGGDKQDAFVFIYKQVDTLFHTQGQIRYEKFSPQDAAKILETNKKSLAVILPLKKDGLESIGITTERLESGVKCNGELLAKLKQKEYKVSCKLFALQFDIQQ